MSSSHIERLEALLRSAVPANEARVRTALDRVQAELASRLSQSSPESSDFFLSALRALKRIKGARNSSLRLCCLHHCGTFFIHHANYHSALEAATQRYLLASQVGSLDATRTSLNSIGVIHAELGNTSQALAYYSSALEIAREMLDTESEAIVLNNMGTALNYASLYRDAIPCLERVMSLDQATWKFPIAKKSLTNLAQSYYYLESFEEALEAIQRAIRRESAPANASEHFDQALREFTLVEIALELDRQGLAIEHAARCRSHALCSNSISSRLMAAIASARCEVRDGNMKRGLARLEQLLVECRTVDSIYKDALIAVVKAYDEAGQPELSLAHMEDLLGYVRKRRMSALQTLLAMPRYGVGHCIYRSGRTELMALEHKYAHLRARVAEREAANLRLEMLERLAVAADLKEDSSGEHGYRVGRLASLLASRIAWSGEAALAIESAARLHDIGKTGIPDKILGSSQALKEVERHFMSMHTVIGAELLAKSDVPQLRMAEEIARHHHEWWDGSGYPDRLSGKHIPLPARIVALADVFDALTHGRAFSSPWSLDRAVNEIRSLRGNQFDPNLTDRFLALIQELRSAHENLDGFLSEAGTNSPFLQVRRKIRALLEEERVHANRRIPQETDTRH